jgi:hypothetical protein
VRAALVAARGGHSGRYLEDGGQRASAPADWRSPR